MSVYDLLDSIDVDFHTDHIEDEIIDAKDKVSAIDDEVRTISSDVIEFFDNLKDKTFNDVKEFLSDLKTRLDDISESLY